MPLPGFLLTRVKSTVIIACEITPLLYERNYISVSHINARGSVVFGGVNVCIKKRTDKDALF